LAEEGFVTHCADVEGREFIDIVTVNGEPRERCSVVQLTTEQARITGAVGWYYRDVVSDPEYLNSVCGITRQTIGFTRRGLPVAGTIVRFECTQTVASFAFGSACLAEDTSVRPCFHGMTCNPASDVCDARRLEDMPPIQCDVIDRICAISCATDADCTAANLDGYLCDVRTNAEAASAEALAGLTEAQRRSIRGVCVNPNCE